MKKWLGSLNKRTRLILKTIGNIIVFLGLIYLTFFLIFKDQDFYQLMDVIKQAKLQYVLMGILFMFLYYCMESMNIRTILKSLNEKVSFFRALKYTFIGFFFSAITPAASGGQPIEIYYMTRDKIKGAHATMALLIQACGYQISTIFLGIVCALVNPGVLFDWLIPLFLIGIAINSCGLSVLLVGIFSKRLSEKLVNILVTVMRGLRIKNVDAKKEKIEEVMKQYAVSSRFIKSHKGLFIISIVRVFIQMLFYYSVPFFIYKAFGLQGRDAVQIFAIQAILYSTVSGIPLPGAIGISESVFLTIYKIVFGEEYLNSAMLLSRGVSFYLFVIISLNVVMIAAFINSKRKIKIDEESKKILEEIS